MYKEKKINKEKKFLIAFGVLILAFALVKGATAQDWIDRYSYGGYSSGGFRQYQFGNGNRFYNFYYNPNDNGYRWYRDPYYRSIMGGAYNNDCRR